MSANLPGVELAALKRDMNFASDNWAGATEPVMAALARHSTGFAPAYGIDPLTQSVTETFCEIFERKVAVFFVATGSSANALSLSAFTRPGGVVFCHEQAHINVDECGAPEFFTNGNKLIGISGAHGRISASDLRQTMARFPDGQAMHGQVCAVSITQATELGTAYSLDDIATIKAVAEERGVPLHMDGARFANALAAQGVSPADMTWRAGVDVLSFGATKNGCWCAEAVVFFNPESAEGFEFLHKRAGHVFSKSRFVAAQFEGYFQDGGWLKTASYANSLAVRLAQGIEQKGGWLLAPVQANEVFPVLKRGQVDRLKAAGAMFYEVPVPSHELRVPEANEVALRLVTSFATPGDEVSAFLDLL